MIILNGKERMEKLMNNQIDRENIKFLTIIELEDIIFEQYQKINTGTNLRLILT